MKLLVPSEEKLFICFLESNHDPQKFTWGYIFILFERNQDPQKKSVVMKLVTVNLHQVEPA